MLDSRVAELLKQTPAPMRAETLDHLECEVAARQELGQSEAEAIESALAAFGRPPESYVDPVFKLGLGTALGCHTIVLTAASLSLPNYEWTASVASVLAPISWLSLALLVWAGWRGRSDVRVPFVKMAAFLLALAFAAQLLTIWQTGGSHRIAGLKTGLFTSLFFLAPYLLGRAGKMLHRRRA